MQNLLDRESDGSFAGVASQVHGEHAQGVHAGPGRPGGGEGGLCEGSQQGAVDVEGDGL